MDEVRRGQEGLQEYTASSGSKVKGKQVQGENLDRRMILANPTGGQEAEDEEYDFGQDEEAVQALHWPRLQCLDCVPGTE
jgi:hypothetical protein